MEGTGSGICCTSSTHVMCHPYHLSWWVSMLHVQLGDLGTHLSQIHLQA